MPGLYDLLLNPRDRAYTVPAAGRAAGRGRAGGHLPGSSRCATTRCRCCPTRAARPRRGARSRPAAPRWPRRWPATCACMCVYCRRASEPVARADPLDPGAVPIGREVTGAGDAALPATRRRADPGDGRAARAGAAAGAGPRDPAAWPTACAPSGPSPPRWKRGGPRPPPSPVPGRRPSGRCNTPTACCLRHRREAAGSGSVRRRDQQWLGSSRKPINLPAMTKSPKSMRRSLATPLVQ